MRRLGDLDLPLMAAAFVERERLDGAYAVQGLDEKRALLALNLHHGLPLFPQSRYLEDDPAADECRKAEHEEGQQRAVKEHDRQEHDQHQAVEHRPEQTAGEEIAD